MQRVRRGVPVPEVLHEPRRWQAAALEAWLNADRRGIIEVVTGGGKTVFAELCMAQVLKDEPQARFVVIVPSTSLMDQWFVSLQEEFGIREEDLATWSGRSKPKEPALVNVMVINTARIHAARVCMRGPTMLIVDECHRAASTANSQALRGKYMATLGMSATPEREYDNAFDEVLVPFLGKIVYRYDLNAASADGLLAAFDLVNIAIDLCADELDQYNIISQQIAQLMRQHHEDSLSQERLKLLLRKRARVAAKARLRVPVAARILAEHRGLRVMVFHEDIGEATRLLGLLLERGHSATIYHSRMNDAVRRDNLRLYRRGVFDILISCRALDEGINIPETQVAIIASGTASTRQRIQRLGRVLRPAPGKTAAVVYTLYATISEEQRLVREARELESARRVTWRKASVRNG